MCEPFFSVGLFHLRSLTLSGMFGSNQSGGSLLTDSAFEAIAKECPNLQYLNLNYQVRATGAGIRCILQRCQHLRGLSVARLRMLSDLIEILNSFNKKLMVLQLGTETPENFLHRVMLATEGRLLVATEFHGLLDPPSNSFPEVYANSKAMIDNMKESLDDPSVFNEWGRLF